VALDKRASQVRPADKVADKAARWVAVPAAVDQVAAAAEFLVEVVDRAAAAAVAASKSNRDIIESSGGTFAAAFVLRAPL